MSLSNYPDHKLLTELEVLKKIEKALAGKKPFSLVRVGDGENIVLAQGVFLSDEEFEKTYWVQVEGQPGAAALAALSRGVQLNDGPTLPARARLLDPAPQLWPRDPPIRVRQHIPDSWIELVIREGRNRQVRRMTAAVGHPTLRLVRMAIGPYALDGLAPGVWRDVPPSPSKKRAASA